MSLSLQKIAQGSLQTDADIEVLKWENGQGRMLFRRLLEQPMHAYLANEVRDISHSLLQANHHVKRNRSYSTNTPADS